MLGTKEAANKWESLLRLLYICSFILQIPWLGVNDTEGAQVTETGWLEELGQCSRGGGWSSAREGWDRSGRQTFDPSRGLGLVLWALRSRGKASSWEESWVSWGFGEMSLALLLEGMELGTEYREAAGLHEGETGKRRRSA